MIKWWKGNKYVYLVLVLILLFSVDIGRAILLSITLGFYYLLSLLEMIDV